MLEQVTGTTVEQALPGGRARSSRSRTWTVRETLAELRADPTGLRVPNHLGPRVGSLRPERPVLPELRNLGGPYGIKMPEAWELATAWRPRRPRRRRRGDRQRRGLRDARPLSPGARPAARDVRPGWDFVGRDRHPNDGLGHGTHVAGTIAQTTNNGHGTAGIAFGARIMPLKVLDRPASATAS